MNAAEITRLEHPLPILLKIAECGQRHGEFFIRSCHDEAFSPTVLRQVFIVVAHKHIAPLTDKHMPLR